MNSPVVTRAHMVEARDVVKSFGQTTALRGASVAVSPGEICAIMGPSGSGKSTLLHCLAGIFEPDRGEVWFDGQRLDTLGEDERTRLSSSGSATLSAAVSSGTSWPNWNTKPKSLRRISLRLASPRESMRRASK